MSLLQAQDLRLSTHGRVLVDRLTFAIEAGDRIAVLGANGAGKSTLLRVLGGLRAPEDGSVLLDGQAYGRWRSRDAAQRRGWLPQSFFDAFPATVLETALTGRHPHLPALGWETAEDRDAALAALAATDLQGLEHRDTQTLSGGERQRLGLAVLLAQAPRLYLLDEPLAHLDVPHQSTVLDTMEALAEKGAAVVMALHDPNHAARFANRVLMLLPDGGTIFGPAADLLTASELARVYRHPFLACPCGGKTIFVPA